jgi:DnaA N-terminal domain
MSHAAIAGVLARDELSLGERLVAWSLASFANRDQLAWPGIAAAGARAGLGRSRCLEAREQLVRRGLLDVEKRGVGRGRASAVRLLFAQSGPWWDGDVNVELVEAVLGYSRARGPARLLLAALAAISDGSGVVEGLVTEELCRAAGLANSTYRRARAALLASGELAVDGDAGGRGRTCRWTVRCSVERGAAPVVERRRRTAPPAGTRPLVAAVRAKASADVENGPILTGVSGRKGPILTGVSDENPAKTPPKAPPPNVRAGREPLNPGIRNPPSPPEGGSDRAGELFIEETYRTPRGRLRRRHVAVDPREACAGLVSPGGADDRDWKRIRELVATRVGESMFEIWLAAIELHAVDADGALILIAPDATREWVRGRYQRLIAGAAEQLGRVAVIADAVRSVAITAACPSPNPKADSSANPSAYRSYDTSACELSYTPAYNSAKEVGSW